MLDRLRGVAADFKTQFLMLLMLLGSIGRDFALSAQRGMGVENPTAPTAKQLGIFMVLVFGAVALVVVTITLLFGMQIAGEFAAGIDVDNEYSDQANQTVNSTGSAFNLFAVSVLVIPATAVLAVLIGGLIGAVAMSGVGAPGMNGGNLGGR